MSLITIFFSLQSIIFLVGINFSSKKITQYLKLDKKLILLVFSILILLLLLIAAKVSPPPRIEIKDFSEVFFDILSAIDKVPFAKLLFSNKLFRNHSLNEGQKMKVIENFDRAQSFLFYINN